MLLVNLFVALLLQTPVVQTPTIGQTVVVGLKDGQELLVQNPEFTGFIQGHNADAIVMYHHGDFHGEMPLKTIEKIEFGPYKRGQPFAMTITLRNGQVLQVESERRDFVSLRGKTDFGTVTIRQPDPISVPVKLTTRKADRKKDLTIQYLEIPTS
jgi:hypothetical protein